MWFSWAGRSRWVNETGSLVHPGGKAGVSYKVVVDAYAEAVFMLT